MQDTAYPVPPGPAWDDWKWQMAHRLRTPAQLLRLARIPVERREDYLRTLAVFRFAVTPYYLALANPADPRDPLSIQCLPDPQEIDPASGGEPDPLGEELAMPVPGLIHRYPDRCLAIVTNRCALYCRHCNRKHLWRMRWHVPLRKRLQCQLNYVARTPALREVIVSGGDPLTIAEDVLEWFLASLRAIPHVEVLRLGSRVPVVLPMRVTPGLCAMLRRYRPLWFNTQFNHPREITPAAARACEMLLEAGIPVSNQSVLLRGVNDDFETMRSLLYGLQRICVRPYYLFQCDPVAGTGHLHVELARGRAIMERVRTTMSGLCIPSYVIDVPGSTGKVHICLGENAGPPGPPPRKFFDSRV